MVRRIVLTLVFVLLLSVAAVVSAQGSDPSEIFVTPEPGFDTPAIVGGQPADDGEWPWQVELIYAGGYPAYDLKCGGTLIDRQWVLTAAHCVDGYQYYPAYLEILAGIHDLEPPDTGYQRLPVDGVFVHADYDDNTYDNDIALVRLGRDAVLGPTSGGQVVATLPLVAANAGSLAGQLATFTGWGYNGDYYPYILLEAQAPIVTNAVCNAATSYNGAITANMLCAGYKAGGVDTCWGDSGGPLVINSSGWKLAGITSWGNGCANPNYYGVYTRVSRYVAWVNETTQANTILDSHEPNNNRTAATPITYGTTFTDPMIDPAGDVDVFKFTGVANDNIIVDIDAAENGSMLDSYVELMKSDGTIIATNDNGGGIDSYLAYKLTANGTYYFKVKDARHPTVGGRDYFYMVKFSKGTAPSAAQVFVTTAAAGTTSSGLAFDKRDILRLQNGAWSLYLDGSAAGLPATADITAFYIPTIDTGSAVLGFAANTVLPGAGTIAPHDLALKDQSGFKLRFDGSDVGLTLAGEKLDAVHFLPGEVSPVGSNCQRYILLSTVSTGQVPAFGGGNITFSGEDVLGFCAKTLDANTTGVWHKAMDGSNEGLPINQTFSLSASPDGQTFYLTTKGAVTLDGIPGNHSQVFKFNRATGTFSGPVWKAAVNGLSAKVDGLHIEGTLP